MPMEGVNDDEAPIRHSDKEAESMDMQHNGFTLRSTTRQGRVKTQRKFTSALVSSKAGVSFKTRLSQHSTRSLTLSNSSSNVLLLPQQCHETCLLGEADPLAMSL